MVAKKQRYRALTGLTYPADPRIIKRIQAGERIPFEERALKRAAEGEIVDDIPEVSVPWLLEQNLIELVKEAPGDIPDSEEESE